MDRYYQIKVTFYKKGNAIYLSHLDLLRLFTRALRRADFPIYYTSGFNPHPKIKMGQALKLGKEGEVTARFYFCDKIKTTEFENKVSEQIPPGLKIINIENMK